VLVTSARLGLEVGVDLQLGPLGIQEQDRLSLTHYTSGPSVSPRCLLLCDLWTPLIQCVCGEAGLAIRE
jgi:hypothetical protein